MDQLFHKFVSAGNDFLLVNDMENTFPADDTHYIQLVCNRRYGIGADGLILVQPSRSYDFKIRIFNADGSEAQMCGNGIRAAKSFLNYLGIETPLVTFETLAGPQIVQGIHPYISMKMPKWYHDIQNVSLDLDSGSWKGFYAVVGVPHLVIFVNDLNLDVTTIGRQLRYHPIFGTQGTNVNFVMCHHPHKASYRTYERGVEDETLACGTGAATIGLILSILNQTQHSIRLIPKSLEVLDFQYEQELDGAYRVTLTGPSRFLFSTAFQGQACLI